MRTLSIQKNPFKLSFPHTSTKNSSVGKYEDWRSSDQAGKHLNIGKYKILMDEILGKGYSCCVYKGIQEGKPLKKYAIKVIELKGFNATCLNLFKTEIEIHKTLDHQHIVRCYDVYKTATHIYMIMEYCPHGDLSDYIKQKKKIAQHLMVDIMGQILNGYRYLSSRNILHRDLKPSNILRSGKIWKIADFGFSIQTSTGFIDSINVGTPMYMPIQSLARSYYSTKTDIFALGVILYELVHGKTPWFSKSEVQLLRKMCNNKLKLQKQLSNKKLRDFIMKACQIQQQDRLNEEQLKHFSFHQEVHQQFENVFMHSSDYRSKETVNYVENNTEILGSQLNLSKFLYYMIENMEFFLLPNEQKNVFVLILLKFLLKIIKELEDGKFSAQKLINFDQYKANRQYQLLLQEIKDCSSKYEKTYLDYIKGAKIITIRAVNQQFQEFSKSNHPLDINFYQKFLNHMAPLIKLNIQMIDNIINDDGQQENLPQKIQALKNLVILFKTIESMAKHQTVNFKQKTLSCYSSSRLNKSDYLNIRKQMKYI